jgi:hypothetical protein
VAEIREVGVLVEPEVTKAGGGCGSKETGVHMTGHAEVGIVVLGAGKAAYVAVVLLTMRCAAVLW